jgi:NADH:ubiquinone oxidoreductase subunit 5 (subunit L)/multisubunit Na+/H+ antiporter MnhA subunit
MNRIGDILLLVAILIAYLIFGSTDLIIINSYPNFNTDLFIFFFFLAATAKSAQLYLHL